jgi:two-component system, chemotaxis family, protein-glutamate methylesterase/glutaminase
MTTKRVVVIGGSSGALDVVRSVAAQLPAGLPAAVCVVLHTAPGSPGVLPSIIGKTTPLPTSAAETGMRLDNGRIYVAPPDHHLVIEPGRLRITRGPRENCFRPAIDPLFRSAAQVYGPGAIGVILSGDLDDGTAGLWALRQMGGVAIVQDPAEALFPSMPSSAIRHVAADHVVASARIAPLLERLIAAPADESRRVGLPEPLEVEMKIANEEHPADAGLRQVTTPSPFACPECHGVLLRLKAIPQLRFRCHTGHAYSAASLMAAIDKGIEDALWSAVRALNEAELLLTTLEDHRHEGTAPEPAPFEPESVETKAARVRRQAEAVREVILARGSTSREDAGTLS